MSSSSATRPATDEYAPYYERYVNLVPDGSIVDTLRQQLTDTLDLLSSIPEDKAGHRYEPGKWSIKELIGHIIDSERVFAYRALRFARNDKTPLPGFEQDDYVSNGDFDKRQLSDLAKEFEHVRSATIDLIGQLNEEAWNRTGTANDAEVSVRAIAWIISGHELHHKSVLRSKYL